MREMRMIRVIRAILSWETNSRLANVYLLLVCFFNFAAVRSLNTDSLESGWQNIERRQTRPRTRILRDPSDVFLPMSVTNRP